jgi:2-amino-4-hydroxy-6-hydroxymethyldihydropteridine diphosphokinase
MEGYLLGIGSNIEPERNAPRIIERLAARFGRLLLSRFYATAPVGMASERTFLNFCAFAASGLDPAAMKAACVAIELELGRDRAHPGSKTRDRPADIDLQVRFPPDGVPVVLEAVPPYLAAPAAEILALLTPGAPVPPAAPGLFPLAFGIQHLGEAPACIDPDSMGSAEARARRVGRDA